MAKSDKTILGSSGEHYVAAYLAGNGLIVALPRAGIRGSDLFIGHANGGRPLRIQVKTGKSAFGEYKKEAWYWWDTDVSVIERHDENLWFAYVWLNGWPQEKNLPEVFFVPSSIVVECMKAERDKKVKRSFFSMRSTDLQQYKGDAGLQKLREVLTPSVPAVSIPVPSS